MKGFSMPNISIPKVSIPNVSFNGAKIDAGAINSAITSALPDISSITSGLDIEGMASKMLSEAMGDGIELPSELSNFLK